MTYLSRCADIDCDHKEYIATVESRSMFFDYAVGNPPYQARPRTVAPDSTRSVFVKVYDKFHLQVSTIASRVALVYPAAWQSSVTKGFGKRLVELGLSKSVNYPGNMLFGDSIQVDIPISVVYTDRYYHGPIQAVQQQIPRDAPFWLDSPQKYVAYYATVDAPKLDPAYHLTSIRNLESAPIPFYETADSLYEPVRFYVKKTPGLRADGGYYYTERSQILTCFTNPEDLDKYKVSIPAALFKQRRHFHRIAAGIEPNFGLRVTPAGEGFGQTWIHVRSFDTMEEAEHFVQYFHSTIPTLLALLESSPMTFTTNVPDILDYTHENPQIDWNQPLDQQIFDFFGISSQDQSLLASFRNSS